MKYNQIQFSLFSVIWLGSDLEFNFQYGFEIWSMWIRTGSKPHWKIMYCTTASFFYEY